MDKPLIVISVYGGLVQEVYCSIPDARIVLVDWDQDPDPAFERKELVHGKGGCSALVGTFDARPMDDLIGTDVEAAINEAQGKGVLDGSLVAN